MLVKLTVWLVVALLVVVWLLVMLVSGAVVSAVALLLVSLVVVVVWRTLIASSCSFWPLLGLRAEMYSSSLPPLWAVV